MKFEQQNESCFLTKGVIRIRLSDSDLKALRVMTPMGRKVRMRRRALVLLEEDESNPQAKLILELVRLPAKNWAFEIPSI